MPVTTSALDCGLGLVCLQAASCINLRLLRLCELVWAQHSRKRFVTLLHTDSTDCERFLAASAAVASAARPAHGLHCCTQLLRHRRAAHHRCAERRRRCTKKRCSHAAPALRAVRGAGRGPALRAARPLLEGTQDPARTASARRRRLRGRVARAERHSIRTGTNTDGTVEDRRRLGCSEKRPRTITLRARV